MEDIKKFCLDTSKKGTSMILCFYRKEVEIIKEKHKIIEVPLYSPFFSFFPLSVPNLQVLAENKTISFIVFFVIKLIQKSI